VADDLLLSLTALEGCQHSLVMLAARTDSTRKHDLVEERRALALCLTGLQRNATAPESAFASGAPAEEFLSRFSEVRNAIAQHQSAWSAVTIDNFPDEYRRSADTVSALVQGFTGWMRATLDTRR